MGALDEVQLSVAPAALTGWAPVLPRTVGADRLRLRTVEQFGQFQVSGSSRNGVPGAIWFASSPSAGSYTHQHTPHSSRVSSAMRDPSPR